MSMQVDIHRIKVLLGEQAVTIVALSGQVEELTKERDELRAKLDERHQQHLKAVEKAG
jgi:hypothetical protein